MTIKELKEYLNNLPEDETLDDFTIMGGEYSEIEGDVENFQYRVDNPIVAVYIDEDSKEFVLLQQSDDDIEFSFDLDDSQ